MNNDYDFEPQTPNNKRRIGSGMIALIIVVAVIFGTLFGAGILYALSPDISVETSQQPQGSATVKPQVQTTLSASHDPSITGLPDVTAPVIDNQLEPAVEIYEKLADTVVVVKNWQNGKYTGTGSGVIFSSEGYIITNYHVIEGATSVTVLLNDETEKNVELVGGDEKTDIAVLKINDGGSYHAASLGSSANLKVGQTVIAIGSPMGYAGTTTQGIVSALNRVVDNEGRRFKMIQTDCAINPGNSGGPLFNRNGEVIGITSMKEMYTQTSSGAVSVEGLGYAIPIDSAKNIVLQLMKNGKVERAGINATVRTAVNTEQTACIGVEVISVNEGGAADKAGLKAGDIIVKFADEKITTMADLSYVLEESAIGQTVKIVVLRNNAEVELTLTLGTL